MLETLEFEDGRVMERPSVHECVRGMPLVISRAESPGGEA